MTTSIVQRHYMRGSKNSHKSRQSIIHCCWTTFLKQPTVPLHLRDSELTWSSTSFRRRTCSADDHGAIVTVAFKATVVFIYLFTYLLTCLLNYLLLLTVYILLLLDTQTQKANGTNVLSYSIADWVRGDVSAHVNYWTSETFQLKYCPNIYLY